MTVEKTLSSVATLINFGEPLAKLSGVVSRVSDLMYILEDIQTQEREKTGFQLTEKPLIGFEGVACAIFNFPCSRAKVVASKIRLWNQKCAISTKSPNRVAEPQHTTVFATTRATHHLAAAAALPLLR